MIGKTSIELGLKNIWRCWFLFRKGKKSSVELEHFQYNLERQLWTLCRDLNDETYEHGLYQSFVVTDTKTRTIVVSTMRDRVVHRLLYEYLVPLFDPIFHYDVWSCRKGKGLVGAITRTKYFLKKYPNSAVWRGDVQKFFDHVNHEVLLRLLEKKVKDPRALMLLREVICSYRITDQENDILRGIPIGNLTSQIFANVYLHEFDFFVAHTLRPLGYIRYGDDFVLFGATTDEVTAWQKRGEVFLREVLKLELHATRNSIIFAKSGLRFLGVELFPSGGRLSQRMRERIKDLCTLENIGSYYGLVRQFGSERERRGFVERPYFFTH